MKNNEKTIVDILKEEWLEHKIIINIIEEINKIYDISRQKRWTLKTQDWKILQNICIVIEKKYIMDLNIIFDFVRIYVRQKEIELIFASDLDVFYENLNWILKSLKNKFK